MSAACSGHCDRHLLHAVATTLYAADVLLRVRSNPVLRTAGAVLSGVCVCTHTLLPAPAYISLRARLTLQCLRRAVPAPSASAALVADGAPEQLDSNRREAERAVSVLDELVADGFRLVQVGSAAQRSAVGSEGGP